MKLKSIYIDGLHNAVNKTYQLNDLVYLYGRNGAGKTTVLNAIQLALLGYIPGTAKNSREALLRHSKSGQMIVRLELDDNGTPITIERRYDSKSSKTTITPEEFDLSALVADIELPIFNFTDFVGQTANKLKDYFIKNILPISDGELDWGKILRDGLAGVGVEDLEEVLKYGTGLIADVSGTPVEQVAAANTIFKEEQSFVKSELARLQATIDSLIYYDDYTGPKNMDEITANIQRLSALRDSLIRYDTAAQTLAANGEELAKLEKAYADKGGKDAFMKIRDQMNSDIKERDSLKIKIDALSSSMSGLDAKKTIYEDIISQNGVCPYTKAQCPSMHLDSIEHDLIPTVDNNIKELNRQLTDLCMKSSELETSIQQSRSTLTNFQTIINQITALRGLAQTLPEKPATDMSLADIDQELQKYDDAKMKLQANIAYESTIENITKMKYKSELNNSALAAWVKYTDINGLQTSLTEKPFEALAEKMTGYIQTMYGTDSLKAKFNISSKANSFSFGLVRDGKYISYDQLSAGEQCLYTLALMICITDSNKSPLRLILVDNSLDNLDDIAVENTFAALKNIKDIQFLMAGVKACKNAEDVMIRI